MEMLKKLGQHYGLSQSEMLRIILAKIAQNRDVVMSGNRTVHYQPVSEKGLFLFRLAIDSDVYEATHALRYFTRKSVSLMVREAVIEEYHLVLGGLRVVIPSAKVRVIKTQAKSPFKATITISLIQYVQGISPRTINNTT